MKQLTVLGVMKCSCALERIQENNNNSWRKNYCPRISSILVAIWYISFRFFPCTLIMRRLIMQFCLYYFHLVFPKAINVLPKKCRRESNRNHFCIQSDWFLCFPTWFHWKIMYIFNRTWESTPLLTMEFDPMGLTHCWQVLLLLLLWPSQTTLGPIFLLQMSLLGLLSETSKDHSDPVMNKLNPYPSALFLCFLHTWWLFLSMHNP